MSVLVISYSRADQPQVRALVSLLKGGLRGMEKAVYWDEQFDPGEPWFDQLKAHIDAAPQLFVFWCDHASTSEQVRREFTYALGRNKRVVPVLLDDTPLAAELAPIHGIDLRGAVRHDAPRTVPAAPRAGMATALLAVAATLVVLVGATAWWTLRNDDAVPATGQSAGGSPAPSDIPLDGGPAPPPPPPPPTLPAPVVIEGRPAGAQTEAFTDAARTQIDAMLREAGSSSAQRIVIRSRAGRGLGARAAERRSEALKGYIARQHAVPLDQIEVQMIAAPAIANETTPDGVTANTPPAGSIVVSIEPPAVSGSDPGTVADPGPVDVPGPAPDPGPAARRPWQMGGMLLILAATVLAVFGLIGRSLRQRERRRLIVREFERHLANETFS